MHAHSKIDQETKGNLALLGVGALYGASSPVARIIDTWASTYTVVFIRFLFALPFLLYIAKNDVRRVKKWQVLLPVGIVGSISPILFTLSLFYTKISLAIFTFYIVNLISSIVIGKLFYNESINNLQRVGFIVGIVAIVMIADPFASFSIDVGMAMSAFSGVLASVGYFLQKNLSKTYTASVVALAQAIVGIVLSGLVMMSAGGFLMSQITGYNGVLCIVYGAMNALIYALMAYGFTHAKIGIGSLLTASELVFGPLLAFILFKEILSMMQLGGALLIILATVIVSFRPKPQ